MPKAFSENERDHIRHRLIEEAELCLERYGYKKTTVDEIARRAKIPKGTFYLFYESKELLIFDVFIAYHDRIHAQVLSQLQSMDDSVKAADVTALIFTLYKKIEDSFMYRFLMDGDMELLFRKLPQKAIDAHTLKDDLSIQRLVSLAPGITDNNAKIFSAALRAVFTCILHRREVGEDIFDEALKIMIHGIVIQMFEEKKDDQR